MSEKIYCGSATEIKKQINGDEVTEFRIYIDFAKIPDEHKKGTAARVIMQKRKQADEHGNTHYLIVNTWKPNQ